MLRARPVPGSGSKKRPAGRNIGDAEVLLSASVPGVPSGKTTVHTEPLIQQAGE